jgi:hypothetical protein
VLRRALLTLALLLLTAAPALAHDGGEGWYGPTNDQVITNAGFLLLAFFPLFVFFASVLQWRLDKRKERRKAAGKARTSSEFWRSGW